MKKSQSPPRRLTARFYRAADGTEPVDQFIERQRAAVQLAIDRKSIGSIYSTRTTRTSRIRTVPKSRGGLRELRCHYGAVLYRILYRRSEEFVVLLHIFEKRTKAVPEADKQIARERWSDFKSRIDAKPRQRPSPIGKKAPPKKRS